MSELYFEAVTKESAEAVLPIEKACFLEDTWGLIAVSSVIADPYVDFTLWYLEGRSEPIGYIAFRLCGDEAELYKIAVLPEMRKNGYARKMMEYMTERSRSGKAERILLEVRENNTAAVSLYKRFGFAVDGVRKNYYKNPTENAILMSLDLNERQ